MRSLTTMILILLAVVMTSKADIFDCDDDFYKIIIAEELEKIREQQEEQHQERMDAIAAEAELRALEAEARWYDEH